MFQSIVLGSLDSGSVVRHNIMVVGACGRGNLPWGGQEAEGETERDLRQGTAPKDKPLVI
jgi:hypothetical protein